MLFWEGIGWIIWFNKKGRSKQHDVLDFVYNNMLDLRRLKCLKCLRKLCPTWCGFSHVFFVEMIQFKEHHFLGVHGVPPTNAFGSLRWQTLLKVPEQLMHGKPGWSSPASAHGFGWMMEWWRTASREHLLSSLLVKNLTRKYRNSRLQVCEISSNLPRSLAAWDLCFQLWQDWNLKNAHQSHHTFSNQTLEAANDQPKHNWICIFLHHGSVFLALKFICFQVLQMYRVKCFLHPGRL